jgi:hypothetical protein
MSCVRGKVSVTKPSLMGQQGVSYFRVKK